MVHKCVECGDWLKSPRQLPLCEKCYQELLDWSVENDESKDQVQ